MALDYVGMDVPANSNDYKLNSGRIIRFFVQPDPFLCTFTQYLITFCSRPEAASGISGTFVGLTVPD